jgi:hypothetical protein
LRPDLIVRPYQTGDRQSVLRIAADSAFFGDPVEAILEDRRLINAYLVQLMQLGLPGVHLMTTDRNPAACRLHQRMGFVLLDSGRTRLWDGLVDGPVQKRCYGMLIR